MALSLGQRDHKAVAARLLSDRPALIHDGELQQPGGWNRVVLRALNLPTQLDALKNAGVKVRNQIEAGPVGRQIQIEDPDGNPIELFEAAG